MRDLARVVGQIELGRVIGIIHRKYVRSVVYPNNVIAFSSLRDDLKPKGNLFTGGAGTDSQFLPRELFRSSLKRL